ncbi:MAG TPA: type II toxin-antitoxin system Phd/YefM family antitoxin [Gammaproteobacteria bacterium]|nr:type II toxin-antitoxin system Phd/YefM family antitoxin [Gammaproteobacteria bacterium]
MREYSFTEARQHFASLLEEAKREGVVCIKKRDGEAFYIKPVIKKQSPLDVEGVDLGVSSSEIVEAIREGRERKNS